MNTLMYGLRTIAAASVTGVLLCASAYAEDPARSVNEHRPVDPAVQIEVNVTAGRVTVVGWEKAEIEVTGSLGVEVERLEVTGDGPHASVRAVTKKWGLHWGGRETSLVIKVPKGGSLAAHMVSADLRVSGIAGSQELQTVSGDIESNASSEARLRSVSGNVHLEAAASSRSVQVSTVSGDVTLGGTAAGELSFQSVSGDGHLRGGAFQRVYLKTVSGDLSATLGLSPDGRFEAETVSGDVSVHFPGGLPAAEYSLSALSGELSTCDGRHGAREGFGPGTRLSLREGAATGRVRIDSKSGDIDICGR